MVSTEAEEKRPWFEHLLLGVAIVVSLIIGIAAVSLLVLRFSPWLENPSSDRLVYLEPLAYLGWWALWL